MRLILLVLPVLLFPLSLLAANGMSCHCFQDRSYNPAQPGAADEYVLATTQNSLLSVLFDLSKKTIVSTKMSGTPGDDLWLAGYVAEQTGRTLEQVLELRKAATGWNEVLVTLDGFPEWLDPAVARPILGGRPAAETVSALVDLQVAIRFELDREEIAALRQHQASNQELILIAMLSRRLDRSAEEILRQQRELAIPWDMLLNQAGISPQQIDPLLRKLLAPGRIKS